MEPKGLVRTFWVVEARDEHNIYSGSGWSRQLAGSTGEHATPADALPELDAIAKERGFDRRDLRVAKRVRHG